MTAEQIAAIEALPGQLRADVQLLRGLYAQTQNPARRAMLDVAMRTCALCADLLTAALHAPVGEGTTRSHEED